MSFQCYARAFGYLRSKCAFLNTLPARGPSAAVECGLAHQMLYLTRIPAPPLGAFVRSIWYAENGPSPHAFERVLPNGTAQLIVNLKEDQTRLYRPERGFACETTSGAALSGLQTRYSVIDTAETECVIGAVFHPGGTVPFFGVPAHELRDASISLELLWGRWAGDLREQLLAARGPQARLAALERAMERMLARAQNPAPPHPAVAYALGAFQRLLQPTSIAEVTAQIGLSPKRFIERFKAAVGVSPKRYCRILRFQSALAEASRGEHLDWTRIAMDCGYFDQAHFIHDFRAFAGITPGGYRAQRTQFQNHVKFLQSLGAAV
jgi:AraC-like DNA-binding protein